VNQKNLFLSKETTIRMINREYLQKASQAPAKTYFIRYNLTRTHIYDISNLTIKRFFEVFQTALPLNGGT